MTRSAGGLLSLRKDNRSWGTTYSVCRQVTNLISTNRAFSFLLFHFLSMTLNPNLRYGRRVAPYGPADYYNDVGSLINTMNADSRILNKNMLIGPSVATGHWTPEQVWDTGFIDTYKDHLYCLSVEQ